MSGQGKAVFDFHGCAVEFSCADPGVLAAVSSDFSCFAAPEAAPRIRLAARLEQADRRHLPRAVIRTRRWSVLRSPAGRRLVWYPEGALCDYDYVSRSGTIRSSSPDLLKELSYLLALSRAGEELDRRGLHRLHAGALGFGERALLFCAGRGTGKTTLLLELLKDRAFSLLSDDTPLVDRGGTVYPFPARIGLGLDSPHLAAFAGLGHFSRRHYAPKRLLDTRKAGFRISGPLRPRGLFLLRRAERPEILRAGGASAFRELAISLAAGYGVPQLAEFFLRPAAADIARKTAILASRLRAAAALYDSCDFYIFRTGPEPAANAEALKTFLRSGSAAGAGGL